MGNLSNLYISQSFQSLAHLGTNTSLVPGTMTQLQDGIGQSLNIYFDGTNISSSGNIYGANITASVINTGSFVTTSSFNSYSQSVSSSLTTLSASLTVTDTFLQNQITALDVSGAAVSLVYFNQFTASQLSINSGYNTFTSSANIRLNNLESTSASVNISIANLNSTTASQAISISNLNASSASQQTQIDGLSAKTGSYATSAITASSIITASVNDDDITFTKGDGSQFTIQVATGSFAISASFAETASIARNLVITARNGNPSTLPIGTVVHITSAVGDNPIFNTASYDTELLSANTLGVLRQAAVSGTDVEVVVQGKVISVNTDPALGYAAGDVIYLSSSGQFTRVQPQAPNQIVVLGQVLRAQQNNGSIYVSINNGWELNELHNVQINGVQTGDLLQYESSSYGLWKNKSIEGAGITSTSSFNSYTSSTNTRLNNIEAATSSYVTETESGSFLITASVNLNTITFTKGDGTTFPITVNTGSGGGGGTIDTGSFATTGSNTFTGEQTLIDNAGNFFTISDASGSMMLVGKGFTSASAHISASSAGIANIIFKANNNTADTIISGSNNIFVNPNTPTAGFKRYIGGNGNIINTINAPQISGSMQFSPTMAQNYQVGTAFIMRGPVSSSAWTLSNNILQGAINIGSSAANHAQGIVAGLAMSTNNIGGTLNIVANRTNTTQTTTISNNTIFGSTTLNMNSSSVVMQSNIMAGTNTITNNTSGSSRVSATGNAFNFTQNIIWGGITITASGSNDPNDTSDADFNANIYRSLVLGESNTIRLQSGLTGSNSMAATSVIGNNLIVTGSSPSPQFNPLLPGTYGSAFFGRFNSVTGNSDLTAETVFAVGTGTSTSARKTGFLIDSGSNTFVEGTFNVSGATSLNGNLNITGSLTASLQQGFLYVGNASGITTTVATSSFIIDTTRFATTGSNFFNGNQTITGSLLVSGAFETTQDITIQDASGNPTLKIGRGAGNQPSNLRFGVQALATAAGLNNIAIGNSAMQYSSQSLATENIAIGGESLQYTQEGQQIAIGTSALRYTTTGKENLAVGAFAMQNNITGTQNIAVGFNSLYNHTDGTRNIAIGPSAAQNFRSGSNNIFIGYQTANSISGSNNVILGAYNGTGETINNNIILADGAGNKELQFSGSTWTTENNFVVSGSLSAANNIKMGRGVDKPTNKVTVGTGGLIVSNSLVTADSYIFATNDTTVGNYSPVVSNITAGSFSLSNGGYGGNIDVMYMIVNPY